MTAHSNYQLKNGAGRMGKYWKPCRETGCEHLDVSEDGFIYDTLKKGLLNRYPMHDESPLLYVWVTPKKGFGKPHNVPVSRLVYEAWNECSLPALTRIYFHDGNKKNYYHENLYVKGEKRKPLYTTVISLPTVKVPESNGDSRAEAEPIELKMRERAFALYQQTIKEAYELIKSHELWVKLEDIEALFLLSEEDLFYAMHAMSKDELVRAMIDLLRLKKES